MALVFVKSNRDENGEEEAQPALPVEELRWSIVGDALPPTCAVQYVTIKGSVDCDRPSTTAVKRSDRISLMYFCDSCLEMYIREMGYERSGCLPQTGRDGGER